MPLDCGYETQQDLYARLKDVASRVRNNAADLARRCYHHRQQVDIDLSEYVVLSESASFLAFIELGGDSDDPNSFDWQGRAGELVTKATAHVRRDLQEKGSDSHDVHYRNQPRREVAPLEEYAWTAWSPKHAEERHENEQLADVLAGLLPELERAMDARELDLLKWRYVDGLSQKEIAEKMGGTLGMAAMGVMRAKRRAAAALGDRWKSLVKDAVLAA